MTREIWLDVVARLSAEEPVDLDPILMTPAAAPPAQAAAAPAAPTIRSARLWTRDETVSCIGIRIDRLPDDPRRLALRLASAAAERGVVPIILSTLPRTGLEQFGFRVERLPAGPPEAAALAEAELRRFWDMPIVVSLSDVERLG
jgi:hypothetical protein